LNRALFNFPLPFIGKSQNVPDFNPGSIYRADIVNIGESQIGTLCYLQNVIDKGVKENKSNGKNKKSIVTQNSEFVFASAVEVEERTPQEMHYACERTAGSVAGDIQANSLSTQHNAAAGEAREVAAGQAWEPDVLSLCLHSWRRLESTDANSIYSSWRSSLPTN